MSDNASLPTKQDRTQVDIQQRQDVEEFAKRLGVMPEEVRSAADKVGKNRDKIREYFRNKLSL